MLKNIKLFSTNSDRTTYESSSSYETPYVSKVTADNSVHYNKIYNPNGHEYVDLGLPSGTKWATTSLVGVYNYGYAPSVNYRYVDTTRYQGTENPLSLSVDSANVQWGGDWHIPTAQQVQELIDNTNCSLEQTGYYTSIKYTSKKDSSKYITIDLSGIAVDQGERDFSVLYNNEKVEIWTSTPVSKYNATSYILSINGANSTTEWRNTPCHIHPVLG